MPARRLTIALVALLGAVLLAAPAASKPDQAQAGRIHSITPAVAERGSLVTITGNGFGAKNVKISVDGARADVVSATGSKATFRVPARSGPGDTIVRATNPGGQVGTIGLHVLFDGLATPIVDEDDAVTATIGRAGGSLSAGGVTLTIPPEALSGAELITMTPIAELADSPLEGSLIGGVRLAPEGLRFLRAATLTMPLPADVPASDVLGFASATDGSDLHLVPRSVGGGAIKLELWHFSTGGASSGGASAAAVLQSYQPTVAESAAQQRIAAAQPACEAELAQGIVDGPACTHFKQEQIRALFDWYVNAVSPGLQGAVGAPSFDIEHALAEWLQWAATVEAALNDLQGVCGSLQNECNQARSLATTAVASFASSRLQNCTGTSLASQFRDVARVSDFVAAGALDLTSAGVPADLLRACAHLKIEVLDFPAVAALLYSNTLRGRVTVDVYTGADRTDVPFSLTVDGTSVSAAADGSFQANLTPTATPLNVRLEAQATNTDLQNPSFGASTMLARPARDRVELQALSPTTIDPGGTVTLRVRVAGDGMAGASVGLTVSGSGSVSPSPVTTDGSGESTTVYTASSTSGGATVTATLADGTTAGSTITIQAPITVTVSPTAASLNPGGTAQFSASITGTTNTAVTWSETGGSITQAGLYTAGSTPGTFTVTATSTADPSKSATASVQINAAGTIILERRVSRVVAQCSAQAYSEPAPVSQSVDDLLRSDVVEVGTFSESAAAGASVVGEGVFAGNNASCNGAASQTDTLGAGPTSLSIDFTGSANGSGNAEFSGDIGASEGTAVATTFIFLVFRIEGAPLAYTADGSFSSGLAGPGGSSFNGSVQFYRRLPNGSTVSLVNYARRGDHRTPTTVPSSLSTGGVLQPGRYELLVDVDCAASGHETVGVSGNVASCTSDGTLLFVLGAP